MADLPIKRNVAATTEQAVAPNATSIAQAHFSGSAWFRGIYADDTPVGFMMVDAKPDKSEYFLWRLMIGSEHQGKGYGRKAIDQLAANIKCSPGGTELKTSCVEGDGSSEGFYTSLGFERTGEKDGSEVVLRLDLSKRDTSDLVGEPIVDVRYVVRSYFERLLNQKDLSVCEERLSDDYVDHDAPASMPSGPHPTIDYMRNLFEERPDYSVIIHDLIVEGKRAALRMEWSWTDTDTGEPHTMDGNVILQLNDRLQFTERWSFYE